MRAPVRAIVFAATVAAVFATSGPLAAQGSEATAKRTFERAFIAAVRSKDAAGLKATLGLIEALEPKLRARARFGVQVRLAEILLVQGDLKSASDIALSARAEAMQAHVYTKSLRPLVLLILWQAMPEGAALHLLDRAEREYLRSGQPLEDAPLLRVFVELIRSDMDEDDGQYALALERVRHLADELRSSGVEKSDPWRQKVVLRLFWLHFIRREYDAAKLYLRDLPVSSSLRPRALLALRQRDYVTAEKAARRLAKRDRRSSHLLADVLEELNRFDEAEAIYTGLLADADPQLKAFAKRGLGDCILGRWLRDPTSVGTADLDVAARFYEAALAEFERGQSTQMLAEQSEALRQLARVCEARQDPRRAHGLYRDALHRAERGRKLARADVFGGSWYGKTSKHDYLASIDGLLRTASAVGQDSLSLMLALEVGKARTMLDWIHSPPQIDERSRVRATVRALAYSSDPEAPRRLAGQRGTAGQDQASIVSRAELEQMIAEAGDSLFLSYWLGGESCWLVWCGLGASQELVQGTLRLGEATVARRRLLAAALAVQDPQGDPQEALARAADYFVPVSFRARMTATHSLVFCPDAELGRLPFEALPIAGTALGIEHSVERAPSLSVRQRVTQRRSRGDRVVVVDSIDDTAAAGLGLDSLRFSEREGNLVAAAYPSVTRLRGVEATLSGLRRQLAAGQLDLVHINAHAVPTAIPTESVLVLEDGPASIASLADLPVAGAFVVLSACSSAAGEMRGGEGELGLLGWPLASGARGAVAALWPVSQQATADLMGQFHHHRAQGLGEPEAMRAARATLAASANYAHPYYWAGFAVYGGAVQGASVRSLTLIYALAGLVASMVLWIGLRRRRTKLAKSLVSSRAADRCLPSASAEPQSDAT